ncbi:hypothetical protein SAY87_026787 [Trapa incisa]|uniref:Protein POLAR LOCALIZATION DURING ASYMMETRIC DIVISION AND REDISTRIBUTION n=1 Tax=Trapa incisa TaxID=236973 RepID=A0AAN7GS21_9MYRT|nr:hypothetical protein SAY87_026787 [Trapa incisa]
MWQVLLAAAVAGSTGLIAKHLFSPPTEPSKHLDSDRAPHQEAEEPSTPLATITDPNASECDGNFSKSEEIFRFSSSGSASARSKCSKKKLGSGSRNRAGKEACADESDGNDRSLRGKSGKKVFISLKKRKTGKNVTPRCGSHSSKESSLFNYGLGVGVMYMMSAGKAEISKLNTAMDETAKVIKELKTELHRRKTSKILQDSSSSIETHVSSGRPVGNQSGQANKLKLNTEPNDIKMSLLPAIDDGEYASSVLTDEPERELMGKIQLEAELESELEKLHWSIGETSSETHPYLGEAAAPYSLDHEAGHEIPGFHQYGVLPSELNQKLSQLLIKQQESQITELEAELNSTQSKLLEKESELQAFKDCVRQLSAFSLSNGSGNDDETGAHDVEEWTANWDYGGSDAESKRRTVGMKRPMDH